MLEFQRIQVPETSHGNVQVYREIDKGKDFVKKDFQSVFLVNRLPVC